MKETVMYDKEKVVEAYELIITSILKDLNTYEKVIVLTNCLLNASEDILPTELKEGSTQLLSNGKRISRELIRHEDNLGLNVAYHSHIIMNFLNKEIESDND